MRREVEATLAEHAAAAMKLEAVMATLGVELVGGEGSGTTTWTTAATLSVLSGEGAWHHVRARGYSPFVL